LRRLCSGVRNKKQTIYCYDETEKQAAIKKLGEKPEITRFKGLGEISPEEFARFIGDDIKLQPVIVEAGEHLQNILEYYMGKNTMQRQEFIIDNLKIELDLTEDIEHDIEDAKAEAVAEHTGQEVAA
jgi:topoisomerase-4 subunit B